MLHFTVIVAFIVSYLIGSISFAIIVSCLRGLEDPRSVGSGNPGATNVARRSIKAGIWVLLGDCLKGFIPVYLAMQWGMETWEIAAIGFAVFLGHLFPLFHRFLGGKGVATFLGFLAGVDFLSAILWCCIWLVVVLVSRFAAVASIIACLVSPALIAGSSMGFGSWSPIMTPYIIVFALMGIMTTIKHKDNISRLLLREEKRFSWTWRK